MLEALSVRCSRGGREILKGVDLSLGRGDLLYLLGPNGSGKSTLLRCLLGLIPFEGEVRVDGVSARELGRAEWSRLVSYVPQLQRPSEMSVLEAVMAGRRPHMACFPSRRDVLAAGRALERVGLSGMEGRRLFELSGGELQRVSIARALAQEPSYVLLDEPTNHLDLRAKVEVMRTLLRVRDEGVGVLMVTHDVNLALAAPGLFVLLKGGEVVARGDVEALTPSAVGDLYGFEVVAGQAGGRRFVLPVLEGW